MKTLVSLVIASASMLVPLPSAAGTGDGHVTGAIDVEDRKLKLTKVLVVAFGNEEGSEAAPYLRIVVSDVDVPMQPVTAFSHARLREWAQAHDATVAVITADASGRQQGGVYALLSARGVKEVPIGSASGNQALAPFQVAAGRASGKAVFESSNSLIDATFDAPIVNAVATLLDGRSAASSEQVTALAAFRDALRNDDLKSAAKHATARRMSQIAAFKAQSPPGYRQLIQAIPSGERVRAGVTRVVVRGDVGSIVQHTKEVTEMLREGDGWKVD